MPLYLYECRDCKEQTDVVHPISEMTSQRFCACGGELFRVICATNIQMDYPGYHCPVSGKWIEGRAAHKANLDKHGCRVLEAGERELMQKRRAESEKAFDRTIEETAAKLVHNLPPEKKQQLKREAERNLCPTVVRQ